MQVPEAQCLGPQHVGWAVRVGAVHPLQLARAAAEHRAPLRTLQLGVGRPAPDPSRAHLHVEGALVTATKPAEVGDQTLVRLVNPTPDPIDTTLTCAGSLSARAAELDETPRTELGRDSRGRFQLTVAPFSAATVLLTASPGDLARGQAAASGAN